MRTNQIGSPARRVLPLGLGLLAMGAAWQALAQVPQVVSLPEVVVTATRVATPLEDVVRDVTVLGREEIEASGASNLFDLLARLPGIQGAQYDNFSGLYIRGAGSRMTAVFVDGVRVDRQDGLVPGGGAPWPLLPLEDVERIEVLLGAASSLYGSDGMGGVVLVTTTPPDEVAGITRAKLGMGSSNERVVGLKLNRRVGQVRAGFALSSEQSDGYDERPDLVHLPANLAGRRDQINGQVQLGSAKSGGELTVGVRRGSLKRALVVDNGNQIGANYWDVETLGQWRIEWNRRNAASGIRVFISEAITDLDDTYPWGFRNFQTTTTTLNVQGDGSYAKGRWHAGYEGKIDKYQSPSWDAWNPSVDARRGQNAVYGGLSMRVGRGLVQMDARYDSSDSDPEVLTGTVSAGYEAYGLLWRGSIGSGYRLPTLSQRFSYYGAEWVRPEQSVNVELTAKRGNLTEGESAVTAYRQQFHNMVVDRETATGCPAGGFCATNIPRASIIGWTMQHKQPWGPWLGAASIDGLLAKNDSGADRGKDLNLRPRLNWKASLQRQWADVSANLGYQFIGRRFNDAANTEPLAAYGVWNVGVSGALSRRWGWRAKVDNLTDAVYENFKDYRAPGRRWSMQLEWRDR